MKKTEKLTTLKARLWRLVSLYVRKKNMDSSGYVKCVTCGQLKPFTEIHAGHFLPKKKGSAVYFELKNIHPQCASCNVWKRGNLHAYYDFMLETYGQETIDHLKSLARLPLKITGAEYQEMIEDFKQKLSQLE